MQGDEEGEEGVCCGVCGHVQCWEGDEMVLCDGCDVAVHQHCYGIQVHTQAHMFL